MDEALSAHQALVSAAGMKGAACLFKELFRNSVQRSRPELLPVIERQVANRDAAQVARLFQNHVVDRRQIAR